MSVYTGYFSLTNFYKEQGYYPVSIARYTPKNIQCGSGAIFAPSKELLDKYKKGTISWEQYDEIYNNQIKSMPLSVWHSFDGFYQRKLKEGYKGIVLICYERHPEDCHRSLLAKQIEHYLGYKVYEFGKEKEQEFKEQYKEERE